MTRFDAYVDKQWQETGIALVLIARIRDDGSADFGGFLVDLLCLGVKDAFGDFGVMSADVNGFVQERLPEEFRERIHPACAKKMIEGAVAYAKTHGFAPHRDYRKARKLLTGIDASQCPTDFTFGEDGKPCYVRSSDDDDIRVERVLAMLEARYGPDGYSFVDLDDDDAGADEDGVDSSEARDALIEWLDAEPENVPRFYEFSGLVTGLLLCPKCVGPLTVNEVLWGPDGRVWANQAEAQQFCDRLMAYWNYVNSLILDCVGAKDPLDASPVDVWEEDFWHDEGPVLDTSLCSWARGFLRATEVESESWQGALQRPDLTPHWEILRWWADFVKKENRDAVQAAANLNPPRTLGGSVATLACALRQPI
ncbi:MAG: UPF0149 family protein [Opitutaceae bacterium]|nr:UPF0149 family protein [Opitutaceae bacterium]